MKRHFFLPILILFLGLTVGCDQYIEVELPGQEPRLVINSLLEEGDTLKVFLTKSIGVLDEMDFNAPFEFVEDAEVKLSNSKGEVWDLAYFEKSSHYGTQRFYYQTGLTLEPGQSYRLTAQSEGLPSVAAEVIVPQRVPIKEVRVTNLGPDATWPNADRLEFTVVFADLPGRNYYELKGNFEGESTLQPNTFYSGSLTIKPSNPAYDRERWFEPGLIFDDLLFTESEVEFKFTSTLLRNFDLDITLYLAHVSPSYFYYESTSAKQKSNEDDFLSQPVLVYTNIENGLGIFKARTRDKVELELRIAD